MFFCLEPYGLFKCCGVIQIETKMRADYQIALAIYFKNLTCCHGKIV